MEVEGVMKFNKCISSKDKIVTLHSESELKKGELQTKLKTIHPWKNLPAKSSLFAPSIHTPPCYLLKKKITRNIQKHDDIQNYLHKHSSYSFQIPKTPHYYYYYYYYFPPSGTYNYLVDLVDKLGPPPLPLPDY